MENKLMVEQWGCLDLAFSGRQDGNPFTDFTIRGVFEGEKEKVAAEGFYDGDGTWRVRFMPSYPGNTAIRFRALSVKRSTGHLR